MTDEQKSRLMHSVGEPLIAVVLTLLIGFAIVCMVSDRPILAYENFLFANFRSGENFSLLLNRSSSLIIIGVGIVFAFRAGVFNIGGEGQLYLGAIAATACGILSPTMPGLLGVLACLAASALAGALGAALPAVLKVALAVDEVVTTMMLNFVAMLLTLYLVTNVLRDAEAYGATSLMIPDRYWLASLPGLPGASVSFLVALVVALAGWVALFRTEWGAMLRTAGTNPRYAQTIGIGAGRLVIGAMLLSGALAGLAGGLYVLGVGRRFEQNFSPGFGLIAVTTALLSRVHPIGVVVTSIFYAMMLNGAAYMQIAADVPRSLVMLLTGIMVLLMTAEFRRRAERSH